MDELPLHDLHTRHPGVTKSIGDSFAEAAAVCLARHHKPPTQFSIVVGTMKQDTSVSWTEPSERIRGAWNNDIDTTECGAYGMSLAAIEISEGMVAVRRAETRTGADYYVAAPDAPKDDLETWERLEISGVGTGSEAAVWSRVSAKLAQTRQGRSNLPAMAAVVGFECN